MAATSGRHGAPCAKRIAEQVSARGGTTWDAARAIHAHCGVTLLRAHRYASGWTLVEVTERLRHLLRASGQPADGLAHQRVSQWENGTDVPSPRYLDALCQVYRSRPDRLGYGADYTGEPAGPAASAGPAAPPVQPRWAPPGEAGGTGGYEPEEEEMERRKLLGTFAATAIAGISPGSLLQSLRTVRRDAAELLETQLVSTATVDHWEMVVQSYGLFANRPPLTKFLTHMMLDFDELRRALSRRQPLDQQRRLYYSMARLATLIGVSLNEALDAPRETRGWFHVAHLAADEAGDRMLRAWVTAKEGLVYLWYDRPAHQAVDLARTAQLMAGSAPNIVSSFAASIESLGHAALGREREVRDTARRTEAIWEGLPPEQTALATQLGFCEQNMRRHRMSAYTRVGDFRSALAEQDRILELPSYDRISSALLKLDRAVCLFHSGETVEACRLSGQTLLELPAGSRGGLALYRTRELAGSIPAGDRSLGPARDLAEVVRQVGLDPVPGAQAPD